MLAMLVWAAVYELCFKQSHSICFWWDLIDLFSAAATAWSHNAFNVLQAPVAFKWSGNTAAMETDQINSTQTRVRRHQLVFPTWSEWSTASCQPRLLIVRLCCDADVVVFPCPQLRKVERDKKTMEQEIVDLTNKLLDAKNTINRLEELNVSHKMITSHNSSASPSQASGLIMWLLWLLSVNVGLCVCRSATDKTVTSPSSCSNATNHTSGTTSLLM